MQKKLDIQELEEQALGLVNESHIPVTTDYIARKLHVAWDTARALLLGMACQNRLRAVKTMKSWIFQKLEETEAKDVFEKHQNLMENAEKATLSGEVS